MINFENVTFVHLMVPVFNSPFILSMKIIKNIYHYLSAVFNTFQDASFHFISITDII